MRLARRPVLAGLSVALGAALALPTLRSARAQPATPLDLVAWLDRFPATVTGNPDPGALAVTVIHAPWCPYCRDVALATRDERGYQLRWLGMTPRTVEDRALLGALYAAPDAERLLAHFAKAPAPPLPASANPGLDTLLFAMNWTMARLQDLSAERIGYPSFIARGADGRPVLTVGGDELPTALELATAPRPPGRRFVPVVSDEAGPDLSFAAGETLRVMPDPEAPTLPPLAGATTGGRVVTLADGSVWHGAELTEIGFRGAAVRGWRRA